MNISVFWWFLLSQLVHPLPVGPACSSDHLISPVRDYLLPMWYGTVLRIWPQQDSWMRPLEEGRRGWEGGWCVIVSTAFLTSGPKPHRPPRFKTMRVQTRASDMGWGQRVPGGSTDHLKGIQILFYGCWPFIKCDRQSMDAWVRLWGKRNMCAG